MTLPMLEIAGSPVEFPLVFLPGWGFDGRVLELRANPPRCSTPADLIDPLTLAEELAAWLDRQGIARCGLAGWSLGGLCALDFASRFPERVAALYLLGVRVAWPAAELTAIRLELARQPEDFLRSFYRKCFLGYRSAYRRFQQELEEQYLARALTDPGVLQRGLDFLARPAPGFPAIADPGSASQDCATAPGTFSNGNYPAHARGNCSAAPQVGTTVWSGRLHCRHGRRDLIAPVAERLRPPGADCQVLEQGGHALFLEDWAFADTAVADSQSDDAKSRLRRRFNRAAATYDDHADIQRQALELLAAQLPASLPEGPILELGCGTGNYTLLLARRFPATRLLSLDFSGAMIQEARRKIAGARAESSAATTPAAAVAAPPVPFAEPATSVDFICQEGETFLTANRTPFALITANATLQWFSDPVAVFKRIRAGLQPQGLLLATIFGRESLVELDQALAAISGGRWRVAARAFPDRPRLQSLLADFTGVEIAEHRLSRSFASLAEMLRHFRHTGTGGAGMVGETGRELFSRRHCRELTAFFAERQQGFTLSFQIFVVRGRRDD